MISCGNPTPASAADPTSSDVLTASVSDPICAAVYESPQTVGANEPSDAVIMRAARLSELMRWCSPDKFATVSFYPL
jgi:hypothetical protein